MTDTTRGPAFGDLCADVADYLGYGRTPTGDRLTEVRRYVNAGIRRFLSGVDPRTHRAYAWSFLAPEASLVLWAPVAEGTATVSGTAAEGQTALTADAAVFHDSMLGSSIAIDGVGAFPIAEVASATEIVVAAAATCSDADFALPGDGGYVLPADFAALTSGFAYEPGGAGEGLCPTSAGHLRRLAAAGAAAGTPQYYALVPADPAGPAAGRWAVRVFPRPALSRTVYYRYRRNPPELSGDSDALPAGPQHAPAVAAACLAVAEAARNDGQTHHADRAEALLAASIDLDAANKPRRLPAVSGPASIARNRVNYA